MMVRRVGCALYLLVATAEPAIADIFDECNQSADLELRLAGCTAIIDIRDLDASYLKAAYNNRGIAHSGLGSTEEAIADFSMAISIDPDYLSAYINRGYEYANLPQYFLAFHDFNYVIEVAPGIPAAYVGRGYAELRSGGSGYDAIPDFDMAIALLPTYADAYYRRGDAYRNIDDYVSALADYDRAIALGYDDGPIYFNRGMAHCRLNQRVEATADFEASWARDPETVVRAQDRLRDRGLLDGRSSGIADDATRSAMKTWTAQACPY